MLRIATSLIAFALTITNAYAPIQAIDIEELSKMPWPEVPVRALRIEAMLEDLFTTPPGQDEPDEKAVAFERQWHASLARKKRAAASIAAKAAAHEAAGEFSKALALYEKLWRLFPEQQELIGTIKRKRAIEEVRIDLSTPQEAFTSLERALMTYKLTAPTFGITPAETNIYEVGPVERRESDKLQGEIPELTPEQERYFRAFETIIPSFDVQDVSPLEALGVLSEKSGVPIVVTRDARAHLAGLDTTITLKLNNVPFKFALRYLLRRLGPPDDEVIEDKPPSFDMPPPNIEHKTPVPDLRFEKGKLPVKIYLADQDEPSYLMTGVRQHDHGIPFLDAPTPAIVLGWPDAAVEELEDDTVEELEDDNAQPEGVITWLIRVATGTPQMPEEWTVHVDDSRRITIVTAPGPEVAINFNFTYAGDRGCYFGRVWPLFRCLRAYPLVEAKGDPYPEDIKEAYVETIRLGCQELRMQTFLDDRASITRLLDAKLLGIVEHKPNRFRPRFDSRKGFPLASRLGVWFDGTAYRFLLFDSKKERARWLRGRDWHDAPRDWPDMPRDFEDPRLKEWGERVEQEALRLVGQRN